MNSPPRASGTQPPGPASHHGAAASDLPLLVPLLASRAETRRKGPLSACGAQQKPRRKIICNGKSYDRVNAPGGPGRQPRRADRGRPIFPARIPGVHLGGAVVPVPVRRVRLPFIALVALRNRAFRLRAGLFGLLPGLETAENGR